MIYPSGPMVHMCTTKLYCSQTASGKLYPKFLWLENISYSQNYIYNSNHKLLLVTLDLPNSLISAIQTPGICLTLKQSSVTKTCSKFPNLFFKIKFKHLKSTLAPLVSKYYNRLAEVLKNIYGTPVYQRSSKGYVE